MAKEKVSTVNKVIDTNRPDNIVDRTISLWRYGLSFEQQKIIETNIKCSDLLWLTHEVYQDKTLDKHTPQFTNVRSYLAKIARGAEWMEFTPEQLEFIENNARFMRPAQIARHFFPNAQGALQKEIRTISEYCKAKDLSFEGDDDENDSPNADYTPPTTDHKIIAMINNADPNANFAIQKLDSFKKSCIASVKANLNSDRFVLTMNSINRKTLRRLFEKEFINATYDKPDLNSEDRNLYITQCYDYVIAAKLLEQMTFIDDRIMEVGNDEEGRKLSMTWVEARGNLGKEYKECQHRITQNAKQLSGERSKRKELQQKEHESLINFIKLVQDENKRKRLVMAARAQEIEIKKEIDKLDTFDSIFCEIHGISKDEILAT